MFSISFNVVRDFDTEKDFITSEIGTKEYKIFGIKIYKKDYRSITNAVNKEDDSEKKIGFKK